MTPEALADEARRRNDEAVRRLREESRLRIERGRAAGPTRCMLGTMLALLLFVALESRRLHWQEVAPIVAHAREAAACERFARRQAEIEDVARDRMAGAFDVEERRRIGVRSAEQLATARRFALEQGCEAAALQPPPPAEPANVRQAGDQGPLDTCGGVLRPHWPKVKSDRHLRKPTLK